MDSLTLYRLGEIRQAEILEQAERDRQPGLQIKPVATAPIGRLLLRWGARMVASSDCANVAAGNYTITICSAQNA